MEIQIKNFKLNVFKNLLEQSLIVDNQLMFEISSKMIKSCSFSQTKSFMKLWMIPFTNLICKPEKKESSNEIVELFEEEPVEEKMPEFDLFNMYILKGELFKKFLSVYTSDTVDIIFNIQEVNGKKQAASLNITGKSEGSNVLTTNFILTIEELITNKVDDYSAIIKECTPNESMFEFVLSDKQIQEVKRLIKKLHKSNADNTAYLTFTIDSKKQKIIVNDKVFTVEFDIDTDVQQHIEFPENSFNFNILKSDFVITGNQTFTIYTEENNQKVIFGAHYAGSIIWCLTTKVTNVSDINLDASIVDSTIDAIDALDIDEYFD